MPRPSRSVAGLCIAVLVLSAFLSGLAALEHALLELRWVPLPDDTRVAAPCIVPPGDEQPVPLRSHVPSRAPPSLPLA